MPFTRITLSDPATKNISATRLSRTMFRSVSIRLLPRQSGSKSVRASAISTTGPASPRGEPSTPSGPTVEITTKRLRSIQAR